MQCNFITLHYCKYSKGLILSTSIYLIPTFTCSDVERNSVWPLSNLVWCNRYPPMRKHWPWALRSVYIHQQSLFSFGSWNRLVYNYSILAAAISLPQNPKYELKKTDVDSAHVCTNNTIMNHIKFLSYVLT